MDLPENYTCISVVSEGEKMYIYMGFPDGSDCK